MKKWYP